MLHLLVTVILELHVFHFSGDDSILKQIISTWGEMFSSSAVHTQTTALGEGIKQCIVGRSTITTITTRDWQVKMDKKLTK